MTAGEGNWRGNESQGRLQGLERLLPDRAGSEPMRMVFPKISYLNWKGRTLGGTGSTNLFISGETEALTFIDD